MHPCHTKHLGKLNRASGQIEAVKRMIKEGKYCVDIMIQIKAARSALKAVELSILETHMNSCLNECLDNQDLRHEKISEILSLLKNTSKWSDHV